MKSELEKQMQGYEYPVSIIFEKRRTRNKGFNKNLFTLLEWCVVMHVNFNGNEFYHSYQSIADDTDLSRSTVKDGLKELKEKGYISIQIKYMGKTKNEITHIQFNPSIVFFDLDKIYDREAMSFGYPKKEMYPRIEAYYKRLAEVSGSKRSTNKEVNKVSIQSKEITDEEEYADDEFPVWSEEYYRQGPKRVASKEFFNENELGNEILF